MLGKKRLCFNEAYILVGSGRQSSDKENKQDSIRHGEVKESDSDRGGRNREELIK